MVLFFLCVRLAFGDEPTGRLLTDVSVPSF